MSQFLKRAVAGMVGGAGLFAAQSLWAAGFSLLEQNGSGLGNAYAGSAAVAEDASTLFYNSAGLTQLDKPSLVVNASLIDVSSKFKNGTDTNVCPVNGAPTLAAGSCPALGQSALGGAGGNAGGTSLVPAIYVAVPLTESISGGVGINAPFGLKTEYDADWLGRFQAIKSDVSTMNINTALAFKLGKQWSLGIGIDYQSIDAELTSAVNYSAVIAQFNPALLAVPANHNLTGTSSVKGNDSAWGYDAGILFTPTEHTRIGLSYRSAIKYVIDGTATFVAPTTSNPTGQAVINGASNPLNPNPKAPFNGSIQLRVKLPASARLAFAQQVGSKWQLLGEVSWMQWSSIPELRITRSSGAAGTLKVTPENWSNTWRYAVGANYQLNPVIKLRVGAAIDRAPVPDATRTPRLPDNNRTWVAVGTKVNVNKHTSVDLGYARVTAKDASFQQPDDGTLAQGYPYGLISGHQETSINIFSAQATVTF